MNRTELQTDAMSPSIPRAVFPFCKGCGHTAVLRKLGEALDTLRIPPRDVVLVTDIGCIGLADSLFPHVHTVHTTHGRSTAFASGIMLADSVLAERRLKAVVLIGDGGAMIGLQHLVHAALLNVDVTVLICNNFVYGMTGGQGSSLTPAGLVTATTPGGNVVPPVDLCGILKASHAPFVARSLATDRGLSDLIREAIATPNFAAIEILELCTEHAARRNAIDGNALKEIAARNGWELGRLVARDDREPYYRSIASNAERPARAGRTIRAEALSSPVLRRTLGVVIAGSAGERVQSSAAAFAEAGLRKGYFVTQKNDNPVTQGTGFSLSELKIGPGPIRYTGIERPDVVGIVSADGWREARAAGWLDRLDKDSELVCDDSIAADGWGGRMARLPLRRIFGAEWAALGLLVSLGVRRRVATLHEYGETVEGVFGETAAAAIRSGIDRLEKEALR